MLGVAAILVTVFALFLPWYTVTASSQSGPLAQRGGVTLMSIDGVNGLQTNLFLMANGESSSGFSHLFSLQIPLAILIGVGLILLALDVIGVKNGKSISNKLIFGAIISLLPFILIFVFMLELPAFLPWASQLIPGQSLPPQVDTMVHAVAGNPVYGSTSQQFSTVGLTMVTWGFGIGAYLFIVAAVMRIAAGFVVRGVPELQQPPAPATTPTKEVAPPAAPSPEPSQQPSVPQSAPPP
jgi:hypothetical protein